LAFPAPSLAVVPCRCRRQRAAFVTTRNGPSRSSHDRRAIGHPIVRASVAFASPSKPPLCPGRLDRTEIRSAGLLSWDSPVRPSIVSLRDRVSAGVATGRGPGSPDPERLPPSWFRTTSTVCRPRRSRACCIPLPILGFAAFRYAALTPDEPELRAARTPRDAHSYPSKNPLVGSRTTSPWPLLSCGSRITSRARPLAQPGRTGERRRPMGSGPTIARRTSTHRSDGAAASGPCSADEFVPNSAPEWIPETEGTVLPGLRSPSRSFVARRALLGHPLAQEPAPACAGPGTLSLRGFATTRLAPRADAPGVCPDSELRACARRPSWGF
jgi:hypothetical protein